MRAMALRKYARVLALAMAGALLCTQGVNANPGNLDPTFGRDGIVEFQLPRFDSGFDGSLATYPDAKTVTVSVILDSARRKAFSVQRFTPAGSPDLSFGSEGTQLVYFPGYEQSEPLTGGIAVQPDGKIVVAGTVCSSNGVSTCKFAAFRLLSTGQFDSSFAWGGAIVVPMGYNSGVGSMVIDRLDGGILLAGTARSSVNDNATFALLRLTASGWPDPAFGSHGKVLTRFPNSDARAEAVAVQSTGKILLAGRAGQGRSSDMALARLNRDGSLDATFGTQGEVTTPFHLGATAGSSSISALAVQSSDAIVAVGRFFGISGSPWPGGMIRRYNKDGQLDTGFPGGGSGFLLPSLSHVTSVAVQSDDKIIGTGSVANQAQHVAFRLLPSGTLDNGFGSSGYTVVNGGISLSVSVQSFGCIMLGGITATGQGMLIRLFGDPSTSRPWVAFANNGCYARTWTVKADP